MRPIAKVLIGFFGVLILVVLVYGVFHVNMRSSSQSKVTPPAPLRSQQTLENTPTSSDSQHSIKAMERELQRKPNHTPILLRLAQLSTETGKPAEAEKYLRQVLAQEPNNLDARLELGRVLYQRGNVEGALTETQQVLRTDPRHVDALYNLGAIYGNLNKDDLARKYWRQAITVAPNSESAQKAKTGLSQLKPGPNP